MSGIQWPDSDKVLVAQASQQRLGRFSGIGRATATGDDLAGCAVVVLEKLWSVRPRWRTILTAQTSSLQGQKRKAKTRRGNKARAETRAKQGHGGTRQFAHPQELLNVVRAHTRTHRSSPGHFFYEGKRTPKVIRPTARSPTMPDKQDAAEACHNRNGCHHSGRHLQCLHAKQH
jgi:hypothetical protein